MTPTAQHEEERKTKDDVCVWTLRMHPGKNAWPCFWDILGMFFRKWLGLLHRVDHFVDWCRSEDRPCFYVCIEKSSGKELWFNLFLLEILGFFSLIQTSRQIVLWKICVKIAFFSWSSFLLCDRFCDWNILEPEKVSICRRMASALLAKK